MAQSKINKDEEIFEMKSDINLLKKDVCVFNEYAKRIDNGLEKVGDLTQSMHRMITLHEERISQQTHDDEALRSLMETRRLETNLVLQQLSSRITDMGVDLLKKFEENNKDLSAKMSAQNAKIWKLDFFRAFLVAATSLFAAGLFSGWFSNFFKSFQF